MKTRILAASVLLVCVSFGMGGVRPDDKSADRLLDEAEATARSLKGFSCDAVTVRTFGATAHRPSTSNARLVYMKPNFFDITNQESHDTHPSRYISDGANYYIVSGKVYYKTPIDGKGEEFPWLHNDLLLFLVEGSLDKAVEAPFPSKKTELPDEVFGGETCKVIQATVGGGYPVTYTIYIGPDHIVRRILHREAGELSQFLIDFSISNFQANPTESKSAFQFQPDSDLKDGSSSSPGHQPLIGIGAEAPEFSLPTPAGPRMSLSQALAGKRALLLNFWFVHCPPCRAEHPKLNRFYEKFKDQGLGVLAIDDQDSAAAVAKYMKGADLKFDTVLSGPMAAPDPKTGEANYRGPKLPDYASLAPYGVGWCPTNILLDSTGRVIYESDKWDEEGLRKALASVGVQ